MTTDRWSRRAGSPPLQGRRGAAYASAIVATLVAYFTRHWLDPILPPGFPFLTFFPAVILTAFLAGTGPGLLCAVLSGLGAWYAFVPPLQSFALDPPSTVALLFYTGIVGVDVVLIDFTRRSARRLLAEQERTADLLQEQRLMFQELQHRAANNMAFVSSLLSIQRRKVIAAPDAALGALDEATARLDTMARIHRRLYDPASVELPVGQVLQEICTDLLKVTDAGNIAVRVEGPALRLDISRLMLLSLLVAEVVTNSLKHAFTGRPEGTITLSLEQAGPGRIALTIRDDGRGMAEQASPRPAIQGPGGLGRQIIQGLAKQLGGELDVTSHAGTTTRLVFRAD